MEACVKATLVGLRLGTTKNTSNVITTLRILWLIIKYYKQLDRMFQFVQLITRNEL